MVNIVLAPGKFPVVIHGQSLTKDVLHFVNHVFCSLAVLNRLKQTLFFHFLPESDESGQVTLVCGVGQWITSQVLLVKRPDTSLRSVDLILTQLVFPFIDCRLFFVETCALLSQSLLLFNPALLFNLSLAFLLLSFKLSLKGFLFKPFFFSETCMSEFKKKRRRLRFYSSSWALVNFPLGGIIFKLIN